MIKRWLCRFLAAFLLLGVLGAFPVEVRAASEMKSSDALIEYLKKIEGFRAKPYWDQSQWSIGYGTECPADKRAEYEANGITEETAMTLLREALKVYEEKTNALIDANQLKLQQHQFDALISFSYNCGTGWMTEYDGYFYKAVLSGDKANPFIYAMGLWSGAGGEYILIQRRMSEANMYINGEYKPYNGAEKAFPDTYKWVFLAGCGGTVEYRIYCYDAAKPVALAPKFDATPAGYQFGGWYTADGKKVEQLDNSLSRDQVLYARWLDSAGNAVELSKEGPDAKRKVTVIRDEINLRAGPGTHCDRVGTATMGTSFNITEIFFTRNYTWGRSASGWLPLDYTDYSTNPESGWALIGGKWAYFENYQMVTKRWIPDSQGMCYVGADGYMVYSKWVHDGIGWRYVNGNGYMATNKWIADSQGWCFVGEDGYCLTNAWAKDSTGWCFLDGNGRMVYDAWCRDSYGWGYANANGYRITSTFKEAEGGTRYIGEDGYAVANGWHEGVYYNADGYPVTVGWCHDEGGWFYLGADGNKLVSTWQECPQGMRYIGENGYAITDCWFEEYYFDHDGIQVKERWVQDETGWFYLNGEGKRVFSAWQPDEAGMRYIGETGYALSDAWVQDEENWYRLGADSYLICSQWLELEGKTYYCNADGHRLTGEQTVDGKLYLFDAEGVLQLRYTVIFQNDDGTVLSAKLYAPGETVQLPQEPTKAEDAQYTYTFAGWDQPVGPANADVIYTAVYNKTAKAQAKNGWYLVDGKWYFYEQGTMVSQKWKKDSKGWCYLGADGAMVTNGWVKDSVGWCYVGTDGYCITSAWRKDSKGWCYLDQNGRMVYNRWVKDSVGWCYVGANGYMVTNGWAKDSVGWYWMGSNGYAIKNTSKVIGGKRYNFNASGLCTNP